MQILLSFVALLVSGITLSSLKVNTDFSDSNGKDEATFGCAIGTSVVTLASLVAQIRVLYADQGRSGGYRSL